MRRFFVRCLTIVIFGEGSENFSQGFYRDGIHRKLTFVEVNV